MLATRRPNRDGDGLDQGQPAIAAVGRGDTDGENRVRSAHVRVLVVDDSPSIRMLLSTALSEQGFVPIEAERGADAVRLAVEDPPHVAFIDYHLSDMSGADVVRTLRAVDNDAVRTMPIVGVSGRFGSEQALMAAGACCFLAKPFRDDEVVRAIRWALDVYCQEQRARSRGASSES